MQKNKFNSGLTLIELLVVTSIIGILSTLGLSAFNSSQIKARDAKRQTDVKSIMTAVEQMYVESNSYPSYNAGCSEFPELLGHFPQGIPRDPKTGQEYGCWANLGSVEYCVESVCFENINKANCQPGCVPCPYTGCPEGEFHYCAWSQQE